MPCVIVGATRKAMSKQQIASIYVLNRYDGTRNCEMFYSCTVLIPPLDCTVDSVILHHHPS
jgi:hypothetical protein